jgi:FMN-dependent NADH-azoreductase
VAQPPDGGSALKVLHIISTPREHESNTLTVANAFLEALRGTHTNVQVDVVDLYKQDLPAIAGTNIEAKYTLMMGQPIDKRHEESWRQIEHLIRHFLSADLFVISTPMWNFSIPYALKYYIDCIVQPGYVFKYEQGRTVPLCLGKRMVCITSRGGDYSPTSPLHTYDFQEPYLRAIFGFIGITDMHFVNAQPMDSPALREAAREAAIQQARALASDTAWTASSAVDSQHLTSLKPRT